MKSIFWGAVIIAIGLVRGDSVFHGDFGPMEWPQAKRWLHRYGPAEVVGTIEEAPTPVVSRDRSKPSRE